MALHGMKDSTFIKLLGGHILAEGSLLASEPSACTFCVWNCRTIVTLMLQNV